MFAQDYTAFKDRIPEAVEPVSTRWMILPLALCAWGVVGGVARVVFELVK